MTQRCLSQLLTLWNNFSLVRYGGVNIPLGILNFTVAFGLIYSGLVNHHVAIAIGHFLHVSIGFFLDRSVSFRSPETTIARGVPLYAMNEVLTYSMILGAAYLTMDIWNFNPYFARIVFVTPLSTLVAFKLNKHLTFS